MNVQKVMVDYKRKIFYRLALQSEESICLWIDLIRFQISTALTF